MSLRMKFEPRDLWIGAFVDTDHARIYVCFVPCFPIVLDRGEVSEPLQDESQRTSLIERLDRQLHEALAERDRLAEALERIANSSNDTVPSYVLIWAGNALARYEALKKEAKAQAPKPHEQ